MTKYVDIVLTEDGYFFQAPMCSMYEGDYIPVPDAVIGSKYQKVLSVATDQEGGDHISMIEKYIGMPLPKVTEKLKPIDVCWGD